LFFDTVECAYDIDVEQTSEVFRIGVCDGKNLALFLTYMSEVVSEVED
jgi:hypothetical protein